jgi:WD40 repeat protein
MGQQDRPGSTAPFQHDVPLRAAALSRFGSTPVALDAQGALVGWNSRTRKKAFQTKVLGPNDPPHRLTCSPDGRFVAVSRRDHDPALVRVYRLDGGAEVRRLDRCFSPCFSPDGEILAGTDGPRLRRWALKSGAELPALEVDGRDLKWVAYSPAGDLLAASVAGASSVLTWNLRRPRRDQRRTASDAETPATALAFSPNGKSLAIGDIWGVRFAELTADVQLTMRGHEEYSNGPLKFLADGLRMIAVCQRRRLLLWDLQTGAALSQCVVPPTLEGTLEISEAADAVVWVGQDGLRIDRMPMILGERVDGPQIVCAGFSPEGHVLTGDSKGLIHVWDTSTGKELRRIQGPASSVRSFAGKGRWALFGEWIDRVQIWDLSTGREVFTPDVPPVDSVAVSPDGATLALGLLDGSLSLWDIAGQRERLRIRVGVTGVRAIGWSSDGASIAWADREGTVVIAEARSGGERTQFSPRNNSRPIVGLQFAPDGKSLWVQNDEGRTLEYDGSVGKEPRVVDGAALRAQVPPPDPRWKASGWMQVFAQFFGGEVCYAPSGSHALTRAYGLALLWGAPGGK